jgi:WD40 repeat protein
MEFAQRAEIMGTSFDAHILILDFSDTQMIQLAYDLISPVEITSFAFHPDNERVVMGGCLNGQVITWDLHSSDHRVGNGRLQKEEVEGEETTQ